MDAGVTIFSIAYIVILIVPGIIFKRFYFQGPFSKQFSSGLFADRIITSLFWGIIVQIFSMLIYSRIINLKYEEFKQKALVNYNHIVSNQIPDLSYPHLQHILSYLLFSVVLASLLGYVLYKLIRFLRVDLKVSAFRFNNHWHYYFKGEILKTKEFKHHRKGRVLSTEVDVVVKNDDGKTNMFSGLLTQYILDSKGELNTLYLTESKRYSAPDRTLAKIIPGDLFVIPYSNVLNLNVRYNVQVKKAGIPILKKAILAISTLVLLVGFISPWLMEIDVWRKIVGTVFTFLGWLFFSTLIFSFFEHDPAKKIHWGARIVMLVTLCLIVYFSLRILQVC